MPFVTRKSLFGITLVVIAAVLLIFGFIWSGLYNVGADDPHTRPVLAMMQALRQHSIKARSGGIEVPDLKDPQLILKGAGQYAAMCTGCHLAPGMTDSEIRPGLYPQPPDLSKTRIEPQDAFWVIKHGVKMSAMSAWGLSHDDRTIWSMVAFLQTLPDLSAQQYKDIVAKAPPDEEIDESGHHHHEPGGGDSSSMSNMHSEGEADHHDAKPDKVSLSGFTAKAVPAAEAVAEAFHAALQKGDRVAVLELLSPDAKVSEGGRTQSRDRYAAGHLGEDIAFLKSAQVKPVSLGSMPMGDAAMVDTLSEISTMHDGKPMTLVSNEILTLRQTSAGWRINRIEWSSEPMKQ